MPANLPPQYYEVEKKYKAAASTEEKISFLEELLSIVPKHKGTEKIQAQLKTKISKLKSTSQKKSSVTKQTHSHNVKKSGAGQLVLIGAPNSGKSMLISALTNASPVVSDYPFTTHTAYPAMMKFENIQIQLVDTPPVSPEYMEVWIPDLIKTADGVLAVIDVTTNNSRENFKQIQEQLKEKKIEFRGIDRPLPQITGIFVKKTLIVANKADKPEHQNNLQQMIKYLEPLFDVIPVSAKTGEGLDTLKRKIFSLLNIIRVYSKVPGKKAELDNPYTLKRGSTVMDMAASVHKDFQAKMKFARIWGKNKYQGQKVNRNYILEDEDIIELHT
jgi:ribosome-interacting GTPase 1